MADRQLVAACSLELFPDRTAPDPARRGGLRVQWRLLGVPCGRPTLGHGDADDEQFGLRAARAERAGAPRHESYRCSQAQCAWLPDRQRPDRAVGGFGGPILSGVLNMSIRMFTLLALVATVATAQNAPPAPV